MKKNYFLFVQSNEIFMYFKKQKITVDDEIINFFPFI